MSGVNSETEIELDYVWRVVRDAARQHWTQLHDWQMGPDDYGIRIWPGGAWEANFEPTPDARALLNLLLPLAAGERGCVVGQLGQSLDGRIATPTGDSYYVTSHPSRVHLHRLRAVCDAVVVGASTVATDDPRLTVRHADGSNPMRVILDPQSRLAPGYQVFDTTVAETTQVTARDNRAVSDAVDHLTVPIGSDGSMAPHDVLHALAERGLKRVLIEGGADTVSRFYTAKMLDRLHLTVAPFIIGSGPTGLNMPGADVLTEVARPSAQHYSVAPDMLFDLDIASTRASSGSAKTS